jgi:hypothetical protein
MKQKVIIDMDIQKLKIQKQQLFNLISNYRVHRLTDKQYDDFNELIYFLDICEIAYEENELNETISRHLD